MTGNAAAAKQNNKSISLKEIFKMYFKIGITAFGPAIAAETKKEVVHRRKWLSEEEVLNGLALAQLIPGATFVSLTVYVGYKLRGVLGALVSFFGFLIPPFSLMLLLSFLYFRFGELAVVKVLLEGVLAVVLAVMANAVLEMGKSVVTGLKAGIIALLSFAVMLAKFDIFALLALTALAGTVLYYNDVRKNEVDCKGTNLPNLKPEPIRKELVLLCTLFVISSGILLLEPLLFKLGFTFFKMGALVFGNGFTMIPIIQQEVVNNLGWLTTEEFAVGIALGQITPGPVLITATFIGYKVAGLLGALVATMGIFTPSLFLVMLTAEAHQKVQHNPWVKSAIKGMLAAFIGMMLVVVAGLARQALVDVSTAVLAVIAFVALQKKLDVLWVVIGGSTAYLVFEVLVSLVS